MKQRHNILRACIQKVATGPEHSKDLGRDEAYAAMCAALAAEADPVQVAVLLIALRMKRETPDENAGVLRAVLEHVERRTAAVDELLDIADPYNGQVRGLPVAPFLAPLLAACGLPAYSHGVRTVGPKFGITHHRVLAAAGAAVERSPGELAAQLAAPEVGWGYCDQRSFCPALYRLVALRERIVKRPVLTTVEVLAGPMRARGRTHLLTGYVHKAYPPVYAALAQQAGFDNSLIVRGVEGGIIPSLQQPAKLFRCGASGDPSESIVEPAQLGIEQATRCVPLPRELPPGSGEDAAPPFDVDAAAAAAAAAGLEALRGSPGAARDSLRYAAAIALHNCGICDSLAAGAARADAALDDGSALARFMAAG